MQVNGFFSSLAYRNSHTELRKPLAYESGRAATSPWSPPTHPAREAEG